MLVVFSCCRFVFSLLFMKRFFFTLLQSASLPDAPNLFFPPLFSFHHLRLSIRLVATCEQTARGTPRRTSGRVPATPRRLTLSIFRRVFAAVLAFVFLPRTGKFHEGKDHPDVNPYFPWGHEIPRGSIFWAEAESSWPTVELFYFLNYENRRTYLYIFMYQIPFSANRSLLLVPIGPLRDEGRLLCHGILIAGDRGRAQLVFTLFTL